MAILLKFQNNRRRELQGKKQNLQVGLNIFLEENNVWEIINHINNKL